MLQNWRLNCSIILNALNPVNSTKIGFQSIALWFGLLLIFKSEVDSLYSKILKLKEHIRKNQ